MCEHPPGVTKNRSIHARALSGDSSERAGKSESELRHFPPMSSTLSPLAPRFRNWRRALIGNNLGAAGFFLFGNHRAIFRVIGAERHSTLQAWARREFVYPALHVGKFGKFDLERF